MKKLISFSLYGKNPMYLTGAIRNLELQKEIYPGWTCRFHAGRDVPKNVIRQLKDNGAEIVVMNKDNVPTVTRMCWRFLPAVSRDVDVCLIRDADSRLSRREKRMVDEWLASGKGCHIIRDYPPFIKPIMGGTWGVKREIIHLDMQRLIQKRAWLYVNDQDFLWDNIYPLIKDDVLIHSNFTRLPGETVTHVPFTGDSENCDFMARTYSADDVPVHQYLTAEDLAFKLPDNGEATRSFPPPVVFTAAYVWRRILVRLWFLIPYPLRKRLTLFIPQRSTHSIVYSRKY